MAAYKIIKQQVAYGASPLALTTARQIIGTKITASLHLLAPYCRQLKRAGDDRAATLDIIINHLTGLQNKITSVANKPTLFQTEALASRYYWQAFKLLCYQAPDWVRVHPHAQDSLNLLLNIGYVALARHCAQAITAGDLRPEIGLLHGDNSGQALVYDLMEIFRQIAVDSIILPVFSRRHGQIERDGPAFRKIIALMNLRYAQKFWYQRRCEKLENIIRFETAHLRDSILKERPWEPYRHQWGRHHVCKI